MSVFVVFYLRDGHGGKSGASDGFKAVIIGLGDDFPGGKLEETVDFFEIGGIPQFAVVGMKGVVPEQGRSVEDVEGAGTDVASKDVGRGSDTTSSEDGVGRFPAAEEFFVGYHALGVEMKVREVDGRFSAEAARREGPVAGRGTVEEPLLWTWH